MRKESAISGQKVKITPDQYSKTMFKDGFYNPISPVGYNILTGYVDWRIEKDIYRHAPSMSGKLNGHPIPNF